jgi:histone H1/5
MTLTRASSKTPTKIFTNFAAHPKYSEKVGKAIAALKERGGSSRQAILKYIMANFNVGKDAKTVNVHLKQRKYGIGTKLDLDL